MKRLIFHFVLPLSLLSFFLLTKWWYVAVVDHVNEFMYGFPFIYRCSGFHTSGSTQYFLLEMLANFAVYFAIWMGLILLVDKLVKRLMMPRIVVRTFWALFGFYLLASSYLSYVSDDQFHLRNELAYDVLDTGFKVRLMDNPSLNSLQNQ